MTEVEPIKVNFKIDAERIVQGFIKGDPNGPTRDGVELRSASVGVVDRLERIIELIAAPYNEETVVEYRGQMIRESIEPGAFSGIDQRADSFHVTANREHDYGRTFGKVVEFRDAPHGLVAQVYASETSLGDETLRLAADGVLKASVGMVVRPRDQILKDGLRRIRKAYLDHIALVPNPAYRGAGVLAVRQESSGVGPSAEVSTPRLDAVLAMFPNWPKTY